MILRTYKVTSRPLRRRSCIRSLRHTIYEAQHLRTIRLRALGGVTLGKAHKAKYPVPLRSTNASIGAPHLAGTSAPELRSLPAPTLAGRPSQVPTTLFSRARNHVSENQAKERAGDTDTR